jgi:WD40 repeat protein
MPDFTTVRNRDAWNTIRGYVYQIDLTIQRWLNLQPEQTLELECGEDIDIVSHSLTATQEEWQRQLEQVKHRDKSITLKTAEALTAIACFVEHRQANPNTNLLFRFTTNTKVGQEKKSPIPNETPAIAVWEQIREGSLQETDKRAALQGIRIILENSKKPDKLPSDTWQIFSDFITKTTDEQLLDLISRFEWSTKAAKAQLVSQNLEKILIEQQHARNDKEANEQYQRLFLYVIKRLCQPDIKQLTVQELREQLSLPTLSENDRKLLNNVVFRVWHLEERVQDHENRLGILEQQSRKEAKLYIGQEIAGLNEELLKGCIQLFVGRETELADLDNFLRQTRHRYRTITAPAGFGKTALIANWLASQQDKGYFFAYHFFMARDDITNSVSNAYRNLLRQLYCYYELRDEQLPQNENEQRDQLYYLLQRGAREGKALVIVIDGLDEAKKPFSPPFPNSLPENVFVIASARAEKGQEPKYLEGWTDNCKPLHLERLSESAIAQWLREAGNGELAGFADDTSLVNQLDQITDGFPLYLNCLIDELLHHAPKHIQNIQELLAETPKSFEEYVQQQIKRLDELDLPDERWQFFALLAVAKGALTKKDIKAVTKMRDRQLRQMHLCWQVTRWMRITAGNGYAFAHPLLATTFAAQLADDEDAKDALKNLINYCSHWQEHQSHYALRYYPEHLRDENRWENLYKLLTNFEYIDTKISALGVQPLIEDYDIEDYDFDFNHEYIRTDKKVSFNVDNIKLIQGALRLSAHILAEDKTQLAGRLWGHLKRFDVPEIQAMLKQAKLKQTSPWLCPLTPSLTSPDEPLICTLSGHSGSIWSVVVTPDGEQIISGSQDGTINIWNLNSGNLVHTIEAHKDSVNTVCTDGLNIISGSRDKTIKVWNLEKGELVHTLTSHSKAVNATVLTPDSSKIISGSDDKTLKIWELETGELLHTLNGNYAPVQAVTTVFTKNKKWVIYSPYNHIMRVWNLETGEEFTLGDSDMVWSEKVLSIAATRDGQRVITASQNGTIIVWKVGTWEKEHTFQGHSEPISTVAVTPNGKHIISGSSFDGTIKIWRVGTWENKAIFIAHTASVLAVVVTPDGQKIISASGNYLDSSEYVLKVWNLEKCIKQNNKLDKIIAHSDSVEVVAFTPDGKELISVSKDHTLKIWKVGTWENKATFKGKSKSVCAYWDDGMEKTFRFESDEVECFFRNVYTTVPYNMLASTADGKLQVWSSRNETIRIWDVSERRFITSFTGESEIKCCAISPNGLTIVAGELSGKIHFLCLEGML